MSAAFLKKRRQETRDKIRASLRAAQARGIHIGRKRLPIKDKVIALRLKGFSYRAIAFEVGHSMVPVRRICKEAGLTKVKIKKSAPGIGQSKDTDGNRPWLEFK